MSAASDLPKPGAPCGCTAVAAPAEPAGRAPQVSLVDVDAALHGLLEAWLREEGIAVVPAGAQLQAEAPIDLVIVDVPFPRQGGVDLIRHIASRYPAAPILALSSTFLPGIECCGPVACSLGVACVLPKPARRDALIAAVRRALAR